MMIMQTANLSLYKTFLKIIFFGIFIEKYKNISFYMGRYVSLDAKFLCVYWDITFGIQINNLILKKKLITDMQLLLNNCNVMPSTSCIHNELWRLSLKK